MATPSATSGTEAPLRQSGKSTVIAGLLSERSADWSRRSDKWHAALGKERIWSSCGIAVPPAIFALAVLLQAIGAPRPPLITALAGLLASLVMLRAHIGRQRLETEKTELAWVTADRMSEAYRGIKVRLEAGEAPLRLLASSDLLEARARFGLPDVVRAALEAVAGEPEANT